MEIGEVFDIIMVQVLINWYVIVCGMMGIVLVVGEQLWQFYQFGVLLILLNKLNICEDEVDWVYIIIVVKNDGIVEYIIEVYQRGQFVLVGICDVVEFEELYECLVCCGVFVVVFNVKNDVEEVWVIVEVGKYGVVMVLI